MTSSSLSATTTWTATCPGVVFSETDPPLIAQGGIAQHVINAMASDSNQNVYFAGRMVGDDLVVLGNTATVGNDDAAFLYQLDRYETFNWIIWPIDGAGHGVADGHEHSFTGKLLSREAAILHVGLV